jgi:Spy/CpxP family protein refolding chaperone
MKSFGSRLLIAALTILFGTMIAKSQTAADTPMPPMHGHEFGFDGHMLGHLAKELNITEDQKSQFKAIMQKEHPVMKPLMQQQHQIDLQLRQYVEGAFDEAKVQALAAQKAQIQTQLTVQETRIHNEMYQLLTADQQAQLKQLEAEHEAHMQQRMTHEPAAPAQD